MRVRKRAAAKPTRSEPLPKRPVPKPKTLKQKRDRKLRKLNSFKQTNEQVAKRLKKQLNWWALDEVALTQRASA